MTGPLPKRLNLAIANRCYVSCPGCYQLFGANEPDLGALLESAERFAEFGMTKLTISGGDPLTLTGVRGFIQGLRQIGFQEIKLDTVGTPLLSSESAVARILDHVDYLGLPVDGWSNDVALAFRRGRARILDEVLAVLELADRHRPDSVIVNTVAHLGNSHGLERIRELLEGHRSIACWNVFQFTPTDLSRPGENQELAISERAFQTAVRRAAGGVFETSTRFRIAFHTSRSRLGQYLLINADGEAWLPDEVGRTVRLGTALGRESEVLDSWRSVSRELQLGAGQPIPSETLEQVS